MRARRTHRGVAAIWVATGRRVLDSHGPVCREIVRQHLDMLDRRIHPRLHSGVRCHCFDFSNMVRPDDDSADLRAFRSMAQRRPFSCHPKRPIRDAEILSEETAAPRTGARAESRVENSTSMGLATFILPTASCCRIHIHISDMSK